LYAIIYKKLTVTYLINKSNWRLVMSNEEFQRLVLEKFDKLETRFDTLETRFDKLETRFDTLETRFDTLETRFDTLETRFDTLETRFDTLETRLVNVESDLKDLKVAVSSISEQTVVLTEFKTEVNGKLNEIIESNKSIHEIIMEHEITIRNLKRRPV
jgi:chromosome segregation ATPase